MSSEVILDKDHDNIRIIKNEELFPDRFVEMVWEDSCNCYYLQLSINGEYQDDEDAEVSGVHNYEKALNAANYMLIRCERPDWVNSAWDMGVF